jgi:hypothetical protein
MKPTTFIKRIDSEKGKHKNIPNMNLSTVRPSSASSTARTGRITRANSIGSIDSTAPNTSRKSSSSSLQTDPNNKLSKGMSNISQLTDNSAIYDNNDIFYAIAFKLENKNGKRTLKMLPKISENIGSDSIEFNATELDTNCEKPNCATIDETNGKESAITFLNNFFNDTDNVFPIGNLVSPRPN